MENPFTTYSLWAGLFGGLALFLFGMDVMTHALKSAAGDYIKDILARIRRENQQYERTVAYEFRGPTKLGDLVRDMVVDAP